MNPFHVEKPVCVIWYFCCRIDGEIDDTEVEETQEEKIKWKVKLKCEQISKKVRLSWCIEKTDRNGCEKLIRDPICLLLVSIWDQVTYIKGNLVILKKKLII